MPSGEQRRLELVLDLLLDLGALRREDLAHRVLRERAMQHAVDRRLDELAPDVGRQLLGDGDDVRRIERIAHRHVDADAEALDRLERRAPLGAPARGR